MIRLSPRCVSSISFHYEGRYSTPLYFFYFRSSTSASSKVLRQSLFAIFKSGRCFWSKTHKMRAFGEKSDLPFNSVDIEVNGIGDLLLGSVLEIADASSIIAQVCVSSLKMT